MDALPLALSYTLRPATAIDAPAIRHIISIGHINPTGLCWPRFVLAVDPSGEVIACGQVKSHRDGSLELASIAVLPGWRGLGIARAIIERLMNQHPGRLYLTCRSNLGSFYQKFGFQIIQRADMSPHFQRLSWLASLYFRLSHQKYGLLVMRKE